MVPPRLHLDYDLDFQTRRVDDIAPTLTSPLLFGLVDNIHQLKKPEIPGKPASFKVDEGLWGMWELDQTLAQTLLAKSARVQLIIGEDFTKSLIALHTDLEPPVRYSCQTLWVP